MLVHTLADIRFGIGGGLIFVLGLVGLIRFGKSHGLDLKGGVSTLVIVVGITMMMAYAAAYSSLHQLR